jgi:hypothetical protein
VTSYTMMVIFVTFDALRANGGAPANVHIPFTFEIVSLDAVRLVASASQPGTNETLLLNVTKGARHLLRAHGQHLSVTQ